MSVAKNIGEVGVAEAMSVSKNIGKCGRKVTVALNSRHTALRIIRYYSEEEMDRREDDTTHTRIALGKDSVLKILNLKEDIEMRLEDLEIGAEVSSKMDIGWGNFIVFEGSSLMVHIRRYYTSGDGELLPTKTGVCLKAEEVYDLLEEMTALAEVMEEI